MPVFLGLAWPGLVVNSDTSVFLEADAGNETGEVLSSLKRNAKFEIINVIFNRSFLGMFLYFLGLGGLFLQGFWGCF